MKEKIWTLIGIGLAVLTDVGMGIIVFHLMGKLFRYELPLYFYLVGVFFSLLPDFDLLFIKIGLAKDHHQLPSHYPLVFIPIICLLVIVVAILGGAAHPRFWTSVAALCLFFHYVDDTWGRTSGIGLRWFMPWDRKYYSLWPKRILTEEEVKEIELLEPEEWVRHHYLRLTPELLLGIGIFLAGLAIAIFW